MPKTYILADIKGDWINDVQTTLMLEDLDVTIIPVKSVDALYNESTKNPGTTIIISADMAQSEDFNLSDYANSKVVGFARNINEAETLKTNGIGCIGITKRADKFLELLSLPELPSMYKIEPVKAKETKQVLNEPPAASKQDTSAQTTQQQAPAPAPANAQPEQMSMPFPQFTPEQMQMMMQMMHFMQGQGQVTSPQPAQENGQTNQQKDTNAESKQEVTGGEALMAKMIKDQNAEADKEIKADLEQLKSDIPKKAKIATVYAAKGGVGKTTIATETATFLALTNNGRRRLNVCIVDYNIDFGDVCSHLELNPRGNNMTTWAAEIQEMLDSGTAPEDINFSKNEICSNYLQKMEQTGLYALIAPINHEDSMNISADALKIMLRNIAENGEFDFVICDTGNNTRDAAVIALDMADNILMIATQDITTANCDSAVLKVMKKTGLDTDKVRLVINNVIPAREAGISVSEVIETFSFECVAQIRHTSDIIKANNIGKPLVYRENHDFTKQIQNIVRFLTSGILPDSFEQPKKKRGFWSSLFNKK